ncbi:hypothetical protein [Paenarthrobacter sp. YJN-5]|uniref:hypothetical protein n=1 Tax=Paenarthrobacter sp. YJN-5 TaxID=2735316 RepID=UPI001877A5F4|nr:hypothetical protein [Paenarthrobacter sp. YJN-5]QOT15895.1 hypothetical protein HMI59_04355 [Paenarthrobacter sp. YJN-5]
MTVPDEAAAGGVARPFEPRDSVRIQVSGGTVPDEAVEAAAWVVLTGTKNEFEAATIARAALTAAAPFIAAQAWDEGFAAGKSRAMRHMSDEPGLSLNVPNPYRSGQ